MISNNVETVLDGKELVLEFLEESRSNCTRAVFERLLKHIDEVFACQPDKLIISDDIAIILIEKLYAIACEEELKIEIGRAHV